MRQIIVVTALGVLLMPSYLVADECVWRPWAANWSQLNKGPVVEPPNKYNPTNWDYTLTQSTVLNTVKDTPSGGGSYALHWFLDAQPPATTSNGSGSGGVYQEITVTPGVAMKYSFWWKGAANTNVNWFEFLLIDGPFNIADADTAASANIKRKRENITSFAWETIDDQSSLFIGPGGATLTPTGTTVTVVLKAGRSPVGAMESFFDNVQVWQGPAPT